MSKPMNPICRIVRRLYCRTKWGVNSAVGAAEVATSDFIGVRATEHGGVCTAVCAADGSGVFGGVANGIGVFVRIGVSVGVRVGVGVSVSGIGVGRIIK
jgi:hypothetical protein